jgi:N-acetylmuramoyl-L-alanine amidase
MSRKISEIIVHCSATPAGRDVSAADINVWHKQRGFACIGYHYVVRLDGTVERGRDESRVGAHCLGHNAGSIGVCYVGGCDAKMKPLDTRTDAQKQALVSLLTELLSRYPGATVHGHRDFAAKACPCFDASVEYANLGKGGDK